MGSESSLWHNECYPESSYVGTKGDQALRGFLPVGHLLYIRRGGDRDSVNPQALQDFDSRRELGRNGRLDHLLHVQGGRLEAEPRLARYKHPRAYEVRDELPRTDSGKLLKRVLRDEYWQGRSSAV